MCNIYWLFSSLFYTKDQTSRISMQYESVCGLLEGARTPSPSKIEYNDAFHLPGPIKPLSTKTVTGQTKYQIVTGLNCFLNLMSCSHTFFNSPSLFLCADMEENDMRRESYKSV